LPVSPGISRQTAREDKPLLVRGEGQRYSGVEQNGVIFRDLQRRLRALRAELDRRCDENLKLSDARVSAVRELARATIERERVERQLRLAKRTADAANEGLLKAVNVIAQREGAIRSLRE
jgi:hypothetical protein